MGDCPVGECPVGDCPVGECPVGECPTTIILSQACFTLNRLKCVFMAINSNSMGCI